MLDITRLMDGLAAERPVFHSEADFQHALAWRIREETGTKVRLEFPPPLAERMHLDLWLPALRVAIELKYLTSALDVNLGDERFVLCNQGARDLGRYGFLNDVMRLERMSAKLPARGIAVLLTNDPGYWNWKPPEEITIDAAFRLHVGRTLPAKTKMAWDPDCATGKGKPPIVLSRPYELKWRDYGRQITGGADTQYGRFQYLVVQVRRPG